MSADRAESADDDPLGPVVESFLDRFRRGERPAITDLIARAPDLADQIRELIPALVELEQLGVSAGGGPYAGARAGAGGARDEAPPPERLGDYVIVRPIGGGGMGMVYEAEHESLKSRVALKVMHPRYRTDPKYLSRFHSEARLAAGLHHTNIVSVFDYGEQGGVCYYAMQFIEGQPLDLVLADIHRLREEGTCPDGRPPGREGILTLSAAAPPEAMSGAVQGLFTGRYAAPAAPGPPATHAAGEVQAATLGEIRAVAAGPAPERPAAGEPSTLGSSSLGGSGELRYFREIARVGAQVADALDYAHRRGVLHRDIKPSNLLLDAQGNVWVTDFGLAKLEEGEDLTRSRELVGTLRYMAPERLRGASDRRGDVYSLGATLYELMTLRPPFEEPDQIRLIERIRHDTPASPRQLDRTVPRDLETIVLKAMARDAKDRFASAGEMADELRRFVEGRPIRSRPVSVAERFWRWCKRDPVLAGATIAATVLTIVLAVGSTGAAWVLRGQRDRILRAEIETKKNLFDARLAQARGTRISRRQGQRFDGLKAVREAAAIADELGLPREDVDRLRDEAIACLALPDLEPTGQVFTRPAGVIHEAFDPGMTRSARRFRDGTISVRNVADDREIARFHALGDRDAFLLEFSPDGRYLSACDYPTWALRVWDVDRGTPVVTDPGPAWFQAPFRPDSRRILVGEGTLREYDLATGRAVRPWPGKLVRAVYRPDGGQVAAVDDATRPQTCRIFEADSRRPVGAFPVRGRVHYLAWSPDGRTLATVYDDDRIDLWDTVTGAARASLAGHHGVGGVTASFHPSGTLLASNDWDGRLRLWDAVLGAPLLNVTGGSRPFGRDGRIVISLEDRLTTYRFEPALGYRTFAHSGREPMGYRVPSIRPDGRILAAGSDQGLVLWDLADGKELAFLPIGRVWGPMFEPSGDLITIGSIGGLRWPIRLDAGRGAVRIGPPRRLPLPASACAIARDPSGRIVAVAARTHAYVAAPGRTFRVGPLDDCRSVAVSPDGRWLATGTHLSSRGAQVWRIDEAMTDPAKEAEKVADLPIDYGTGVMFTPDGKWLLAGNPRLRLWAVGTWREEGELAGGAAGFSPDGTMMVVVEPSRILRLVDFATGRTLARLESPDLGGAADLAFSPDGTRLVVKNPDRPCPCVHVWDLRAIREQLDGMGLDWDAPAYPEADPVAAPGPRREVTIDMGAFRGLGEEAWAMLRQVNELDEAGKSAEAIAVLRRLVEQAPDLSRAHNELAWLLATAPGPHRDRDGALAHARRAVALDPDEPLNLNTLGVALYRAGAYDEAIRSLERSLAAGLGQYDAFDLDFLAMAHHRLGHRETARSCFDRAVRWVSQQPWLASGYSRELAMFRAEAESVLAGPAGELPEDVFAPAR